MRRPPRVSLKRRVVIAGALLSGVSALLTGCGSSGENAASTPTRAASATSTPCATSVYRCTRITFTNATPEPLTLVAYGRDQGNQRLTLEPGATRQVTGYTSTGGAQDLLGEIWIAAKGDTWDAVPEDARMGFTARNPQVGRPFLGFDIWWGIESSAVWMSQPAAGVAPAVHTYDAGWSVVRFQRDRDTTHFVEFAARISPK